MTQHRTFTGSTARSLAISTLAAVGLSGCAVMTIDVDVYKGPLINQEEVQKLQFAYLAVAVKPLLIQLRDTLECGTRQKLGETPEATGVSDCQTEPLERVLMAYREDWMEPPAPAERFSNLKYKNKYFVSGPARRVNHVLSLYKDKAPAPVVDFVVRLRAAQKQVLTARDAVQPSATSDDAVWSTLKASYDARTKELTAEIDTHSKLGKLRACLFDQYKSLLNPKMYERRDGSVHRYREVTPERRERSKTCDSVTGSVQDPQTATSPTRVAIEFFKQAKAAGGAGFIDVNRTEKLSQDNDWFANNPNVHLRSDAEFTYLADPQRVKEHALILFGDTDEQNAGATLTNKTNGISDAYLAFRNASERLWVQAVEMLASVDDLAFRKNVTDETDRNTFIAHLAHLVGDVTEIERLILIRAFSNAMPKTFNWYTPKCHIPAGSMAVF